MWINQTYLKNVVPLQYAKEYPRDIRVPVATQRERLGDRVSSHRRIYRKHIRQCAFCQPRHCSSWETLSYIRFSPRTNMAASGFVAVQDIHYSKDSEIHGSRASSERRSSMGRARRASYGVAGKKTIEVLLQTKSQTAATNILRLSRDQVHHVMERAVEYGLKHRSQTHMYQHLSIDEKAVHGREFAAILYDNTNGMVLDVVDGRTERSTEKLFKQALNPIQLAIVQTICMDMWEPYMTIAHRICPRANVCHDMYHLVQYLNKAIDGVRKREVKFHEDLRRTRFLFLKDKMNFTDRQRDRFDSILRSNYAVAQAWRIKEEFRDIVKVNYALKDSDNLYWLWTNRVKEAKIPEMTNVIQMFERHEKGILNAFRLKKNNGRAERMNGSIQELQTIGRGYRDVEHFRTALLFFHGGLTLHKQFLI